MIYIGLNGLIGSGKDSVAKALYTIFNNGWSLDDKDKLKTKFLDYVEKHRYATTRDIKDEDNECTCIAFADQLKEVCSLIFGIPIERLYHNKENSWVCVTGNFEYTETKPDDNHIVTASEFYYGNDRCTTSEENYWMSLREILVYVGTYVCQEHISKNIFVNIANNEINRRIHNNKSIKYVICTDVRFQHEFDYIRRKNGILINIERDGVVSENNIAEHDLDGVEEYDYTIYNAGISYGDLFDAVWDVIVNNEEFLDINIPLNTRTIYNYNYLRFIGKKDGYSLMRLCCSGVSKKQGLIGLGYDSNNNISYIDPEGGPVIEVGTKLNCLDGDFYVLGIEYQEDTNRYIISVTNRYVISVEID